MADQVRVVSSVTAERWPRRLLTVAAKRGMDLVLAALALSLMAPVMAIISLAVALTSPGPVIFRQIRVGCREREFVMFKFRTMHDGNDDEVHRAFVTRQILFKDEAPDPDRGNLFKLTHDPRVTAVGRFLRKTSLDELPQLFNVLRGDMSLVGPRPPLPWEVELFKPEHRVRFGVNPGMTGLWQVSGRSELTMLRALELDVEYAERWTLALDLTILAQTIPAVLTGRGAT